MPNDLYYFGVLVLLFGGFLANTGRFEFFGLWVLVLGLLVGTVGILQDRIPVQAETAPETE
jgi:hypothetical protein